jgi:hypothetical protein
MPQCHAQAWLRFPLSSKTCHHKDFLNDKNLAVNDPLLKSVNMNCACKLQVKFVYTRTSDSCRELLKDMKILAIYSQYIYSLISHTVNKKHLYNTNKEIHKYRTRYNNNLHLPILDLWKFNKEAYFSGIKVFNHLLEHTKIYLMTRNVLHLP